MFPLIPSWYECFQKKRQLWLNTFTRWTPQTEISQRDPCLFTLPWKDLTAWSLNTVRQLPDQSKVNSRPREVHSPRICICPKHWCSETHFYVWSFRLSAVVKNQCSAVYRSKQRARLSSLLLGLQAGGAGTSPGAECTAAKTGVLVVGIPPTNVKRRPETSHDNLTRALASNSTSQVRKCSETHMWLQGLRYRLLHVKHTASVRNAENDWMQSGLGSADTDSVCGYPDIMSLS